MKRVLVLLLFSFSLNAAVTPSPTKAELDEWMREAFAEAGKVPVEERRDLTTELADADYETRTEAIKAALMMIALRPQFYGPFRLVQTVTNKRPAGLVEPAQIAADAAAATEFVEELYRPRMGTDSTEALAWMSGFADFLISAGRWKEALPLVRETARIEGDPYDKVVLAVLEKLNGNDAPYAAILADCPPPPEHWAHLGKEYCAQVARSVVQRMAGLSGALPQAAQDILTGRAAPVAWPARMHGMHTLLGTNPDAAEKELRAILAMPDAPVWAKDDAINLLIDSAEMRQDNARAVALVECFFDRRGAKFAPVTAETWQQLLMMPPPPADRLAFPSNEHHSCAQHDTGAAEEYELASRCTVLMLSRQLVGAMNTKNAPAARRAVERMASVAAANDGAGLANLSQFLWLYSKVLNDPVVAQFAAQLPLEKDEVLGEHFDASVRKQTQRVGEPWASPAQVPATTETCP